MLNGMLRYLPIVIMAAVISTLLPAAVSAQVPVITRHPASASVSEGRDAIFSIEVHDVGTSIQWQKGYSPSGPFSNVANGNGTELHLPNVGLPDSGTYYRAAATLTGSTIYSAPASLTVLSALAPSVQTVDVPANGYYNAGQTLNFQVKMDQSVSVTGTPAIQLIVGATSRQATYQSGGGSNVLIFSYTVQAGDRDLDGIVLGAFIALNGGTIANSLGDAAELALNNVGPTSQILINTNSPTVVLSTSSPPDLPIRRITVTFSEPVTGLTQVDFNLIPTGSAVGSVTGLRTDDNITYDVLVFYNSGTGTFSLQLPANAAVNVTGNGNLASNTLVWRVGSSVNADLQDIRSSSGTLTPTFSSSITSYVVNVGNDVERVSLTSVLVDARATITLNGTTVPNGTPGPAIQLAVGNNPATIIVTAQDAQTTNTYHVNIVRAQSGNAGLVGLVTSAGSLEPAFSPGTTNYALSVPFDTATLQLMPTAGDPAATIMINGNAIASGSMSRPIGLAVGINTVSVLVTARNGAARSYTISANRAALVFPDPTMDPEVIGLLNAQASAAERFAEVQIRNFQNRLEQLHDEGERRQSSFDIRFGGQSTRAENVSSGPPEPASNGTGVALLGYAAEDGQELAGEVIAGKQPKFPDENFDRAPSPFAVWTSGFVNFGEANGRTGLDYMFVGVSAGIDYRFTEGFVAGLGVGYGRDRTDLGDKGTQSRASAYSAAFYSSYKPFDNLFIDALLGGSVLNFNSTRFITTDSNLTDGERDGSQLFGSLTVAYEFRREAWLVSPYGGVEMSRTQLHGYSEGGASIYRLTFGDQTAGNIAGVLGLRANYALDYQWGRLTPGLRAEYTYDFNDSSHATMGYTVAGGLPYALDLEDETSGYGAIGLTLDARFNNAWSVGLEYRTGFGGSAASDPVVNIRIGATF